MNKIIDTVDFKGTNVTCSDEHWNNHIISGHSIMRGNEDAVTDTIQSPDMAFISSQTDVRVVLFKQSTRSTYNRALYTKVVIEYKDDTSGEVVTAFPTKDIKGGIGDVISKK